MDKRRKLIKKQTEPNKKLKQHERKEKKENIIDEDFNLGRFFAIASPDEIYVTALNLHEINSEILKILTSMDYRLLDLLNIKQISDLKIWMILKVR